MTHRPRETEQRRNHIVYLLRLWRESAGEEPQWRASLQDPSSSQRVGFGSLERLFSYLRRKTAHPPERNGSSLGNRGKGA